MVWRAFDGAGPVWLSLAVRSGAGPMSGGLTGAAELLTNPKQMTAAMPAIARSQRRSVPTGSAPAVQPKEAADGMKGSRNRPRCSDDA